MLGHAPTAGSFGQHDPASSHHTPHVCQWSKLSLGTCFAKFVIHALQFAKFEIHFTNRAVRQLHFATVFSLQPPPPGRILSTSLRHMMLGQGWPQVLVGELLSPYGSSDKLPMSQIARIFANCVRDGVLTAVERPLMLTKAAPRLSHPCHKSCQ